MITVARRRALAVVSLTILALLAMGLGGPASPASAAAPTLLRTEMNVLVISAAQTAPYEALMTRDGIKWTSATTAQVTGSPATSIPAFLASTPAGSAPRANFQAVIIPSIPSGTPSWWTTLKTYASTYGVRILTAVASDPNSTVGLGSAAEQQMDGLVGQVTTAGLTGPFDYLTGPVPFVDVDTSWEYSGWPAAPATGMPAGTSMTPLVTLDGSKVLVGVYAAAGLEQMVVTFNGNAAQTPFQLLGPGILDWLTQGTHFGLTRNFLAVHIDDIFNGDARWDVNANCTPGEDCTVTPEPTPIRMSTTDVSALINWQNASGVKLDMAYNAQPSVDHLEEGTDAGLTASILANKGSLRWINHTYNHLYLGCTQITTPPYSCASPLSYVSAATIRSDIESNITWATNNGVTIDRTELISGEHSGLADTNAGRVQADNPNFLSVLNSLGIKVTGSDNSKEPTQRTLANTIGTKTLPRYPNSLYYNVATKAESADEYNWIYGINDQTENHQGNCVAIENVTTCIPLLDQATGFDNYIAPFEARQTLGRLLGNDPKPHFVHQSNIAETVAGDSLVYTWLDLVLNGNAAGTTYGYKDLYATNTPVVNPTMTQSSLALTQQADWNAKKTNVSGYILNGQAVVTNTGSSSAWVPLSADQTKLSPAGTWGDPYEGTRSAWTQLAAGQTLKVDIGTNVAPVASFTNTCTNGQCTFTSTSTDVDSEVGSFTYLWDFGDGTTSTTGPVVDKTYLSNGTYKVTLKVTDLRGGTNTTAAKDVVITGTPNAALPVAVAELVSCSDLTCTFDGSKSSDSDGITAYAWDFGDGSTGTGATPSHTFPSGGDFTVTLTVTDGKGGTGSATVTASVTAPRVNKAPTASFTVTCVDLTCGADASASSDPDGSIVSYQWSFGDGTGATGVNPLGHVFPGAGTYQVSLTVYDNEGASGIDSKTITVSGPTVANPPVATPPVATPPVATTPALPTPTAKVSAVSKKGKLKVDVNPNLKKSGYWKFNVQKLNKDGSWSTLKKAYKTQGKKETRTINFKKGTYRVIVQAKNGYGSTTSAAVTLKK